MTSVVSLYGIVSLSASGRTLSLTLPRETKPFVRLRGQAAVDAWDHIKAQFDAYWDDDCRDDRGINFAVLNAFGAAINKRPLR